MKRGPEPTLGITAARMKRLPRRHRVAHLCALILRQPACSIRRLQLIELLGDEMAAQPRNESRAQ
jgi:hypothetical protein